jgi:hypothetical protein
LSWQQQSRCKQNDDFAYTLNFGKLARIASNPSGGTFLPQSKKTRLNRICTDTQIVMKRHIMAYDAVLQGRDAKIIRKSGNFGFSGG